MYLIDTNIFLRIFFKEENAEECTELLESCERNKIPLVITSFTIHTVEVMLLKRGRHDVLRAFLEDLSCSENIFIYSPDAKEEFEIFKLFKKGTLDFDDSCQYYAALKSNCEGIVSYDPDFDNLEIERKTPTQLLEEFGQR